MELFIFCCCWIAYTLIIVCVKIYDLNINLNAFNCHQTAKCQHHLMNQPDPPLKFVVTLMFLKGCNAMGHNHPYWELLV